MNIGMKLIESLRATFVQLHIPVSKPTPEKEAVDRTTQPIFNPHYSRRE